MRRRHRHAAGLVSLAVAGAIGLYAPASQVAAAPPGPRAAAAPVRSAPRTVTLVTGDRVTVRAGDQVTVQRAPGRERMAFLTSQPHGHLNVVPSDAVPLVRAGRLDPRLFDVTALLEYGYDARSDLPLIVTQSASAAAKGLVKPAPPAGLAVDRDLPVVRGVAGHAPTGGLRRVWRDIIARGTGADAPRVWLDGLRRPSLDVSVPHIGAPTAWAAGFDGTGVTVAVLDTGIDGNHPDLAGKVVAERSFVEGDGDPRDTEGHGTHVASTIAGTGAASGGRLRGVAPGAKLLSGKVCAAFGCADSWIIAGMQWAVAEQHARVVNMSLGGQDTPELDPLEQAVQELSSQYGALFVVSAGNAGSDRGIDSPGSADAALTVGAVDDSDALAPFSSRGPRVGDSALKPDITAPGVGIMAARSQDVHPAGEQYMELSGTSMAAPHVAGVAAILAQRSPTWDGPQLKATLMASAVPNPAVGVFSQGAGQVDVPRALATAVTTSPASVSFGRQVWPHTDDAPITKTVTYHNNGATAVTLALTLDTTPGLFTVSSPTVTVPAGGSTDVTVTADTRVAGPDGFAGGYLVATAGTAVTRTPLGVEKEVESYDLTITHLDRHGQPATFFAFDRLINVDTLEAFAPFDPSGTVRLRLPKGSYLLDATILEESGELSELVQPLLDLTRTQSVTADARTAQPVAVTIPRPSAHQTSAVVHAALAISPTSRFAWGALVDSLDQLFLGPIGATSRPNFVMRIGGQWARLRSDGTTDDSPYVYNLAWVQRGTAFAGLRREVRDRDLAAVRTKYLSQVPDSVGVSFSSNGIADIPFGSGAETRFHLPFFRTEFFSAGGGFWWDSDFSETADGNTVIQADFNRVFHSGRTTDAVWNQAPFGPSSPPPNPLAPSYFALRAGDLILANPALFGGNDPAQAGVSTGTGRIALFRDGALVSEVPAGRILEYTAPTAVGRYRLDATIERGAPFTLSTKVTASWQFSSAHIEGVVAVPMSAVRFSPKLDDRDTAPAGRTVVVPVTVQSSTPDSRNRTLKVDVSYDDGATWRSVTLLPSPTGKLAVLHHPQGPGFVSLRASATDTAGSTVDQTIIRAYRIA